MPNADSFEVEILADGSVKVTTGKFGTVYHKTAEEFMRFLDQEFGSTPTKVRRKGAGMTHTHSHGHGHTHSH